MLVLPAHTEMDVLARPENLKDLPLLARGVNGICLEATSSPEPTMRTPCPHTRSTVESARVSARAAD
jgi:hypothetical protein